VVITAVWINSTLFDSELIYFERKRMKNSSSGFVKALGFVLVTSVLIYWISKQFDLDITTSSAVFTRLIYVGVSLALLAYFAEEFDLGIVMILPMSIVGYLYCWIPALDYWAKQDFSNMNIVDGVITYAWYSAGWIQSSIAFLILIIGYWLIYSFSSRVRYRR